MVMLTYQRALKAGTRDDCGMEGHRLPELA
jgi:hypothetical protein